MEAWPADYDATTTVDPLPAHLRNHMITPAGVIRHSVYYSIVDAEWPAVKARLEGVASVKNRVANFAKKLATLH